MKREILILAIMLLATAIPNQTCCYKVEMEDTDKILIARVLHHECCQAAGEPYESQILLMSCIYNRVKLGKAKGYGNSVKEVIFQKGQFPGVTKWPMPCKSCLKVSHSPFKIYPDITHYYAPKYSYEGYGSKINSITINHGHVYGTWK